MSGQRDIRLLLADVDGILVTQDDVLTEAAKAAARVLNHAGIIFTITRGRPPRGMSMLVEPLALQRAVAGFDGGVFVNPDLSVIDSHKIDPATTKQAVKLIVDRGLDVWVYMDEEWLSLIRPRHMWRTRRGVKFDAKVVASFTGAYLAGMVKFAGLSDALDLVADCEKVTQNTLGEKANAARSQPYYLDVTTRKPIREQSWQLDPSF